MSAEEIRKIMMLLESVDSPKTVELYQNPKAEVTSEMWPGGVTYRGHNVFKTVYNGQGSRAIEKEIESVKRNSKSRSGVELTDYQECYLGYFPNKDIFIQGYDGWTQSNREESNCSPYVMFTINESGTVEVQEGGLNIEERWSPSGEIWSGENVGGMVEVKTAYPDIVDIRLD
jgi:hypothetical protein